MLEIQTGDYFAFYGTLQSGSFMASEIGLDHAGTFLGDCWFRGQLFDLGPYPGAIAGEGLVRAVRYQLNRPSLISALDAYEDVRPDKAKSLFVRERVPLLSKSGDPTVLTAWVYFYNQSVAGRRRIESGVWSITEALQAKQA